MSNEQTTNDETLKRWTAKRRVTLVLEILPGETTAAEAARRHGLPSEPAWGKLLASPTSH